MILKGSQRANASDLATHLQNEYENETIDIAEVKGTVFDDLHSAFSEYEAVASGTKCTKPLYSLSINPSRPITRAQYFDSINRIEKRLGLLDQPRAVIFHVKNGREHAHVVWSRIRVENMKAIHISHDHLKLRTLARELAHEYNLPLPPGLQEDRPYDLKYKSIGMSFAEKAQADTTGITPEQRKNQISEIYNRSSGPVEFVSNLERVGYHLAKGDRRSFVIVDPYGHVYSLSRQIKDVKQKDLRSIFQPLNPDTLPTASQVKEKLTEEFNTENTRQSERLKQEEIEKLIEINAKRRLNLDRKRYDLELVHRTERFALHAAQYSERKNLFSRIAGKVHALIYKLPSLRSVLLRVHALPELSVEERHGLEHESLIRRHQRETYIMERQSAALKMIETRELQSLHRKYLCMARTNQRSRQGRTVKITELRENINEMTKLPVTENSLRQTKIKKKIQMIRENAAELAAQTAQQGRAASLPRQNGRSHKPSHE